MFLFRDYCGISKRLLNQIHTAFCTFLKNALRYYVCFISSCCKKIVPSLLHILVSFSRDAQGFVGEGVFLLSTARADGVLSHLEVLLQILSEGQDGKNKRPTVLASTLELAVTLVDLMGWQFEGPLNILLRIRILISMIWTRMKGTGRLSVLYL